MAELVAPRQRSVMKSVSPKHSRDYYRDLKGQRKRLKAKTQRKEL